MAARQAVWFRTGVAVCLVVLIAALAGDIGAEQRLQNGGFEQGRTGWNGTGFSTTSSSCTAHNGSAAAMLTIDTSEGQPQIQQTITNIASGAYQLRGYARSTGADVTLHVSLVWQTASGQSPLPAILDFEPGSSYAAFNLDDPNSPINANRVIVRISATSSGSATVCLDNLSLEGPPPATATPLATQTPTPTQTPTVAPTSTSVPAATNTPVPTANTPTPQPTSTTASASPSMRFINGGFEDDLDGWQKYGGVLDSVSSPRRSGSRAAAFTSATTSTKWAYQVVAIDPSNAYELTGYVQADAGVTAAYLRISWYDSSDASGSALATDDSTAGIAGGGSGFTYLTTGPRTPPPRSRSARVRIMLAPASAASATVYIDDVSFGVATVAAGTAAPPSAAAAADEVIESAEPQPAAASVVIATPATNRVAGETPTPVVKMASSIAAGKPLPSPTQALDGHIEAEASGGFDAFSVVGVVLGSALAVVGFGGAVLVKRRHGL